MSPSPTPAKVPSSAATYTPATLDPELRSNINVLLLKEGYVEKIQEELLHKLHAHPSNWPSTIQAHAISLLRSGEATTFPALIRRVLEDVRHDTQAKAAAEEGGKNGEVNGNATNGNSKKAANGAASDANSLAMPSTVVDDVLKFTREKLDDICYVADDGDDGAAT
ncbi:hypothetical protein PG990_006370 [Apiospora arundinis]|uniref:Uncharacterized protein n=1 Tax=Apiospora arundinis TaxID=335852 RepID=A0ABR2JAE6_9PEZI